MIMQESTNRIKNLSTSELTEIFNILTEARKLISKGWIKNIYSGHYKNFTLLSCSPSDSKASEFCMVGAMIKATGMNEEEYHRTINTNVIYKIQCLLMSGEYQGLSLIQYNDIHAKRKEDVLNLFDLRIKEIQQELTERSELKDGE